MKHLQLTDELQEKASIYAAGAMPGDERREYVRHLEEDGCTVCTQEVRELQSTASLFGFSLPLATPSETVKSRLMAQAEAVAQKSSAARRPWVAWARIVYELTAAAALILLIFVMRDNSDLRRLAESMNTRITQLESDLGRQSTMLATLTSSDIRIVDLAGQGATPQAGARIFWDQRARKWYVYVHDLPPTPSDRTYQLWFVPKGGRPVSATVFNTNSSGSTSAEIAVPDDVGVLSAAAVTTEPAGGLPQPSSEFVLLGRLE